MKKGLLFAALLAAAAALAGCDLVSVVPAFLLPSAGSSAPVSPSPSATVSPFVSPSAEVTPSLLPTATATPQPSASVAPAVSLPYQVLETYQTTVPAGLTIEKKYANYATPLNYFVALKSGKVRQTPDAGGKALQPFSLGARYAVDALVLGMDGKSRWYHVVYSDKQGSHAGYVSATLGAARGFRLQAMVERANALKAQTDRDNTVYVINYKNRSGLPPALPGGAEQDASGNRRSMSAPAYERPDAASAFVYAPDGLLGTKLGVSGNFTEVLFPSLGEPRWVPTKYISKGGDPIAVLTQLVVVDRAWQNTGTFEYVSGGWKLIALSYVSTGKTGGYSVKTPLGDFMAQERASRFYYNFDGTQKIEGYAPWAVRFSGGGYLHGVPRRSQYSAEGHRTDPPAGEALRTLGTTPQSHMCVRNYTSYAKFIYDWFTKGACAVIVFE